MITLITSDGTMTRVGREELQIENEVTLIEILDRLKDFNFWAQTVNYKTQYDEGIIIQPEMPND